MNRDDVIPPSPPVKLNRLRGRVKNSNTVRHKKPRSYLSLRAKNLQQTRINTTNATAHNNEASVNTDTEQDNVASESPTVCSVNIYAGIDDLSAEEQSNALPMLSNFDILGQPKLIEQCNQNDLKQPRQISASQSFAQGHGLVSLKELISSSQEVYSTGNESSTTLSYSLSSVDNAMHELSSDVQFSEWLLPPDTLNERVSNDDPHSMQQKIETREESTTNNQSRCSSVGHENSPNITDTSKSIVQSILGDFDDDDEYLNREAIAQTPPIVLVKRRNPRTYSRTHIAPHKTLIFDDVDESFGARGSDGDEDDNECTQGTQDNDIDLNASRLIVENLTRLSTFFTQPQSFELDFNTNLSQHSVTLNEEFREFAPELDDFERVKISTDFEEIDIGTPNNSKLSQKDSPLVRWCDGDDDIFADITTPKLEKCLKSATKDRQISTPLSSSKGRYEESSMQSTPSTSKPAVPIEQRLPKRLQFGFDTSLDKYSELAPFQPSISKMQGFATARGNTIQVSENHMKRTAGIFSKIDEEYKQIDPILEQMPCAKKTKHSNSGDRDESLNSNRSTVPEISKKVGFQMASGSKTTAMNAQNFFGEDFNDLALGQRFISNESEVPDGAKIGFATARGTNITVSSKHMERYARTLEEVDRKVKEDFNVGEDVDLNESFVECKTPLRKQNYSLKSSVNFQSISAAAPSGTSMGFATARGSNVQVTSANMEKYAQTLKEVDKNVRDEFDVEMNVNLNEEVLVCKTPLNKNRTNIFATSTPNPNAMSAFKNYPPITPITYQTADRLASEHLSEHKDFGELFDISTQQFLLEGKKQNNTSINPNDTITNDFQMLDESVTGREVDVLGVPEAIKHEREIMLSKQQAESFKEQHTIQPQIAWLQIQKVLSSTKLHELGPPRKFTNSDELEKLGVQRNVIEVSVENALQFKFDMWKFYGEDECRKNVEGVDMQDEMCLIMDRNSRVGVKELTSAFLHCPSVDPKLVPDHWMQNCLKWIIVKLASYERSYPLEYAGKSLTPENVLAQLKYRYGREIDKVQRSAIRKIVEQDDTAAKRMVLFVSRILGDGIFTCSLELCDGWYSIRTDKLDSILSNAVSSRKIAIGTKLVIQGAELIGAEEACSPLEMPSSVALKISANSTRRARWHTKLGYCRQSWPFAISLNSINANGGLVTRMKAFVLRVYPIVYVFKQQSDSGHKTVFRSKKAEQRQSAKDEVKRLEICEKIYCEASEKIEKEYENERKKKKRTRKKVCDIDDGEELWNYMESSNDSVDMELTITQQKLLEDYSAKYNDKKQSRIDAIVSEKLKEIGGPNKSTPLQKIRLIDAIAPKATKTVVLSIWNTDEADTQLRENITVDIQYMTTNGMRGRDVQLTAGRMTKIREVPSTSNSQHDTFRRTLTPLIEINDSFKPHFNEFDTIGFVFKIDEVPPSQLVYISDALKNIFCIKFVGGIKQFAYEDIVQVNKCLVISHLDWRPQNRLHLNGVPQAFVTEITTFTESPKLPERAIALSDLREKLDRMNMDEFIEACCEKLGENSQPNKENSSVNTSKTLDSSMNRTGFNRSAPLQSPAIGVLQRVERLKNTGSPPAFRRSYLSRHKTNNESRKPFKTPSRAEPENKQ